MYEATCPVVAILGADTKAAIVDAVAVRVNRVDGDNISPEAADALSLDMMLASSDETFAAHTSESGNGTATAAQISLFNVKASDYALET